MSSNSDWHPEDLATFRVMVRDDFELSFSRFHRQMEISLIEDDDSALADLFVLEYPRNVVAVSERLNRASKTGVGASLEATSTGLRRHFDPEVSIRAVNFRQTVTNTGRFVLSEQRCPRICRRVRRSSRIPALPGLARQRVWSDIKVITSSGLVVASSDADRSTFVVRPTSCKSLVS